MPRNQKINGAGKALASRTFGRTLEAGGRRERLQLVLLYCIVFVLPLKQAVWGGMLASTAYCGVALSVASLYERQRQPHFSFADYYQINSFICMFFSTFLAIAAKYIMQMQQPVKYSPMNEYANPCYGLLIWVNPDKAKVPGCCWEASRLPPPHCGKDTFLTLVVE